MKFRKIPLTFLILTIGISSAYAKKQPKYEQARQLTAEQAALVQRAVAQEKVLIKNIQLRTPLVETYIQDTRPDVKLYEVPISDDQYMLSRVDFGKGFFDKTYEPKAEDKHGFFKGSLGGHRRADARRWGWKHIIYRPLGFMQMMFLDPTSFDLSTMCSALCGASFWGQCAPGFTTCSPRPTWAGSTVASGLRTWMATLFA